MSKSIERFLELAERMQASAEGVGICPSSCNHANLFHRRWRQTKI